MDRPSPPNEMLVALIVSVVAEAASPVILELARDEIHDGSAYDPVKLANPVATVST